MKDIFISYTSRDKEIAFSLVDFLERNDISCFIAPRDVAPGRPYPAELMRAIQECKLVLLVASSAITVSEHVLSEVGIIFDAKKPLLPIFIEDFNLDDNYRYYLGQKQWIIAYPETMDRYYINILNSVSAYIPKHTLPKFNKAPIKDETDDEPTKKEKTIFEYDRGRGIMINPADHQRNISFRSDTLNNMMGGIFESVAKLSSQEQAEEIFFDTGRTSGKRFAEKINSQWDTGYSLESIKHKVEQWCQFDSSVGWGKFQAELDFDESQDALMGTLTINEAIMVDKAEKRKICAFIRGYCTGVLETLLDSAETTLVCKECPLKNKFRCHCVFEIQAKG